MAHRSFRQEPARGNGLRSSFGVITVLELAAGALSAIGCVMVLLRHDSTIAFYGYSCSRRSRCSRSFSASGWRKNIPAPRRSFLISWSSSRGSIWPGGTDSRFARAASAMLSDGSRFRSITPANCIATRRMARRSANSRPMRPLDNQGKGEAFSPTDLVATALGTCIATTMAIVAERHEVDLKGMTVQVREGNGERSRGGSVA